MVGNNNNSYKCMETRFTKLRNLVFYISHNFPASTESKSEFARHVYERFLLLHKLAVLIARFPRPKSLFGNRVSKHDSYCLEVEVFVDTCY